MPTEPHRMRAPHSFGVALALFIVLGMLHMLPVWGSCDSTILGGPGDATSGNIWINWQHDLLDSGPWPDQTPYLNAPRGESLWNPIFLTAAGVQYPMWLVNKAFSPVCSWNLTVLLGFVACGVCMFGFARWLTGSFPVALFAGYAYAFSPYHIYKGQGHLGYVHSQILVLLLWAGLVFWKKPGWKSAALVGGATAFAGYTDGYYLLIAPVGIATLLGALFLYDLVRREQSRGLLRRAGYALAAAFVAFVLFIPLMLTFAENSSQITGAFTTRSRSDLDVYSARTPEFVLPARSHPVFGRVFGSWQDRHLHQSNYSEQSLFLGWSVIAFGLYGAATTLMRPKNAIDANSEKLGGARVVISLLAVTLVGIWFSAPPTIYAFGLGIPSPSGFIYDRVGFWRVYARFFLLIHAALVPLAAIGIARLVRRVEPRRAVAAVTALMIFLAFEMAAVPPFDSWSYSEAPAEYKWLAGRRPVKTVAEYPLLIPPAHDAYSYITYQMVHGKRLINSGRVAGPEQPIRQSIYGLGDPQTAPVLRRLGASTVLYHTSHDPRAAASSVPEGFRIVERFPQTRTLALTIDPGEAARVCLVAEKGWHPAELVEWRSSRWMERTGHLRVVAFDQSRSARVSFAAKSFVTERTVTVRQGGTILWTGVLSDSEETVVEFNAATGKAITVEANPGPRPGPGNDLRLKSITISKMGASPL